MVSAVRKFTLGEIGPVRMCKRIMKDETSPDGEIPFFKIGTFGGKADVFISRERYEEYKSKYPYPKRGDVLISAAGTIGRLVVFDGRESYFQDSNIVWVENDEAKATNACLYYALQLARWKPSQGSTILRLYNDDIRAVEFFAPESLSDQGRVASILSAIDRKIALNRKRIATLEAMAKEIYDYWFVQFDFPAAHGRPYKSSGGAMVYNPDLKREIPKGWEVVKLSRMADFLFGYPFDSSRFNSNGEGRRIVRIRNVKDGYSNDFTTEDAPSEYIIRNGNLLIGMDGYFDMNIWVGGDAYLVQRSCRVKARDGIYQGYVRRFIAPPIKQLEKTLLGATVAHLGKTHLDDIDIIVPPKGLRAFQMLNDLDASIVQQGLEVAKLSALRDFLLPVLMNGQVKVR